MKLGNKDFAQEFFATALFESEALIDVYLSGGKKDEQSSNRVVRYNVQDDSFNEINAMNEERMHHSSAIVDRKIFVIGGQ